MNSGHKTVWNSWLWDGPIKIFFFFFYSSVCLICYSSLCLHIFHHVASCWTYWRISWGESQQISGRVSFLREWMGCLWGKHDPCRALASHHWVGKGEFIILCLFWMCVYFTCMFLSSGNLFPQLVCVPPEWRLRIVIIVILNAVVSVLTEVRNPHGKNASKHFLFQGACLSFI